jgi:hypothetical protein
VPDGLSDTNPHITSPSADNRQLRTVSAGNTPHKPWDTQAEIQKHKNKPPEPDPLRATGAIPKTKPPKPAKQTHDSKAKPDSASATDDGDARPGMKTRSKTKQEQTEQEPRRSKRDRKPVDRYQ